MRSWISPGMVVCNALGAMPVGSMIFIYVLFYKILQGNARGNP